MTFRFTFFGVFYIIKTITKEVKRQVKNKLLVLVLQTTVLFPNQEIKLELSNEQSKKIVEYSIKNYNSELIIVTPRDESLNVLNIKDVESIASFAKIKNALDLPNGNIRITLRGVKRVKVTEMKEVPGIGIEVASGSIENPLYNLDEELAYSRKLKELVEKYVSINSKISNSILGIIKNITNLSKLTDMIGASLEFNFKQKNKLFRETDYYKRARMLITMLHNEIMALNLENKIEEEVRVNFEKNEKEIIIREKIKTLSDEIGITNAKEEEVNSFNAIIDSLKVSERVKKSMYREVKMFASTMETSPEYGSLRAHLEFITSLPWNKKSRDISDIKEVDEHLNELHYGLGKAKMRIEEHMALARQNKNIHAPVLCLIGPPGTGKTTFARELASSTKREFVKVSVGGLNDSSELIGHRRTYIGAGPGKIMEGIRKCGVNNPIILIDEVDKLVKDYKGDPASVLLEILDQNQNKEFVDNYVQEPFDLSNVLFILTANDESKIPSALYDRLEVIEVSSYTLFDKVEIAKNYTLPRLGKELGYDYTMIKFTESAIRRIATEYTHEAGVRELERKISSIIRKILIKGLTKTVTIKDTDLEKYLGTERNIGMKNDYTTSGVVNVPACTSLGGTILNVEASFTGVQERIVTTGSLGKIMQESAIVALGYLKSAGKPIKIDKKKLTETLHIHALDGATPKDGPSAGLGITVAIVSEVLGKKVPNDIAFTGEITLKGRILKVGGIKEKLVTASNMGIRKVYMPEENMIDLDMVPDKIKKALEIVCVNSFTEVYNDIFD